MTDKLRCLAAIAVFLLAPGRALPAAEDGTTAAGGPRPPFGLANAPDSIDGLLDRFLVALEKNDLAALRELRVSKDEYLDIIVPGTVEKGKPPRQVSEGPKRYFWEALDFKSDEFARLLAGRFGGRHYVGREVRFTKATREYAWYTARGDLLLRLEADDQSKHELQTGWIVEVEGKFKFVGYEWDD